MGVKEVATALSVPKAFLAKLLQLLARHDLIASSRGSNGGFYLKPEHQQACLSDVITCIDGADTLEGCLLGLPVCSSENPCPLHNEMVKLREGLQGAITQQTVESFTEAIKNKDLII